MSETETTADQQTYKRAAHAALVGLIAQLVLAIGMALLGLYAQTPAIDALTWHFFGGTVIWLVLWLVYHQHQLERVEALEAEQLARSDQEAARLFDEAGQQLALARGRLEKLYKFALSGVSLIVSLYLIAVGAALCWGNYGQGPALRQGGMLGEQAHPLLVAGVATGIGFIAFIIGRYVSGMTREPAWRLLRGGAGYLIGSALLAAAVVAAAIASFFGQPVGFAILALAVPALMVLLGLEMGLALLFSIYRPRRAGERPRPGFDSRILGWLTSPESIGRIVSETLNYQFGFEISRSWFYQLLSRAITPLIVVAALVLLAFSSLVVVPPGKQAVITAFGAMGEPARLAGPGLHLKWPWPLGGATKYATGRVRSLEVGAQHQGEGEHFLWAGGRGGGQDEDYLVTAPPAVEAQVRAPVPIGELVGARMQVKYSIRDLGKYVRAGGGALHAPRREAGDDPGYEPTAAEHNAADRLMRLLAQREMNAYFATQTIDRLLAGGRAAASEVLRRRLQAAADRRDLGIEVSYAGLVHVHPPQAKNVVQAFHRMIAARQEKETTIQQARQEAVSMLASVAGSRQMAANISEAKARLQTLQDRLDALRQRSEQNSAEAITGRQGLAEPAGPQGGQPTAARLAALAERITEQKLKIEQLIEQAGGQAAVMLAEARAYRWERPLQARGKADRFAARVAAYEQAPRYYRMRQYLEVLGENLVKPRKIIMTAETQAPPTIRLNLESARTGLESILGEGEQQQ